MPYQVVTSDGLRKVTEEESGRPLAGLHVRAFDKDVLWDDKLGVAVTNAEGEFRIDYSQLDFSSIFGTETSPELYIRVYDVTDKKLLYTSEKAIRKTCRSKSGSTSRFLGRSFSSKSHPARSLPG